MDFKDSKRRASDGRWHIVPAFDEHGQMRLLVTATEGAWIAGTVKAAKDPVAALARWVAMVKKAQEA